MRKKTREKFEQIVEGLVAHYGAFVPIAKALGLTKQRFHYQRHYANDVSVDLANDLVTLLKKVNKNQGEISSNDTTQPAIADNDEDVNLSTLSFCMRVKLAMHEEEKLGHRQGQRNDLKEHHSGIDSTKTPAITASIHNGRCLNAFQLRRKKQGVCDEVNVQHQINLTEKINQMTDKSESKNPYFSAELEKIGSPYSVSDHIDQNRKKQLRRTCAEVSGRIEAILAKIFDVGSRDNYRRAKKVIQSGCQVLIDAMDEGWINVFHASELAKCSFEEIARILDQGPQGIVDYFKEKKREQLLQKKQTTMISYESIQFELAKLQLCTRATFALAFEEEFGHRQGKRNNFKRYHSAAPLNVNPYFMRLSPEQQGLYAELRHHFLMSDEKVHGRTDEMATKLFNLSSKDNYHRLKKVIQSGCLPLMLAVDEGRIAVHAASKLSVSSHAVICAALDDQYDLKINNAGGSIHR